MMLRLEAIRGGFGGGPGSVMRREMLPGVVWGREDEWLLGLERTADLLDG